MEKINFGYSLKNIPTPDETSYKLKLVDKIENVIKRIRWKAHFFIKGTDDEPTRNEHFGFKSRHYPPQCIELHEFEKDLLNVIKSIKFRKLNNAFQLKLKSDITKIKESNNVLVFADKTNNIYEMNSQEHDKFFKDNITKTYKKAPVKLEQSINLEAKNVAKKLNIDDRVEYLAKRQAFITLKDHKENFLSNPSCRLLNPTKSELGKVSKNILEKINKIIKDALNLNQWKNTKEVIEWFNNIPDKPNCAFIQVDIKEFYPSITEKILDNAISFSNQLTNITEDELRIVRHCRKSLLFNANEAWKKKSSLSCFDVTMGSFDGAEVCELVGLHILSLISNRIPKENVGLYRDDSLILLRNANGRQTEQARKDIIKIFKDVGFQLEIETNLKVVNFLDVTFNLPKNSFRPYKKPNDELLYIHTSSNHPPQIIKQLPDSISERLSKNSSDEKIFNSTKNEYEEALRKNGYSAKLEFKNQQTNTDTRNQNRKRNIIWFNPPYSNAVSTNVAQKFLHLIDKHFTRENKLHKIFNRNTVKVSYSCTENVAQIIKAHNKNITSVNNEASLECNCRKKPECPLEGKCRTKNVIYKCVVTASNKPDKVYIGLSEPEWKKRFYNHRQSFNNKKYSGSTTLSSYVWDIKNKDNETPTLKWSILKCVPGYSNVSKKCLLCLHEKLLIITYPNQNELLNKRSELISKCRHENKFMLVNYNTND